MTSGRDTFDKPLHLLRPRETPMSSSERIRIAQAAGMRGRDAPVSVSVPPWVEEGE